MVDQNSQAPEQSPITSQQHNQGKMGNRGHRRRRKNIPDKCLQQMTKMNRKCRDKLIGKIAGEEVLQHEDSNCCLDVGNAEQMEDEEQIR